MISSNHGKVEGFQSIKYPYTPYCFSILYFFIDIMKMILFNITLLRRRMKVLKTDLRNRSVRWFSDNSDHNSTRSNNEYGRIYYVLLLCLSFWDL